MILAANTVVDRAGETVGSFLPRLAGAVALLVIGLLLAWLVGRLVARALQAAGVDDLAARVEVDDALRRLGLSGRFSRLVGNAVRLAISVVTVVAAISLLGLDALSSSQNAVILFLPKLFAAALLILAGIVLGRLLRTRVDAAAERMDLAGPLGPLTELTVIAVFASTALAQLSVPLAIVTVIVAIVIAGAVLALALAFGLGGRDAARQLAAGRAVAASLQVGERISVDGLGGEILAFEGSATLLRTESGDTLRVPNQLLLESVVTVHDRA
jgi:small-conductance mechanosensitive channel